MARKISYSRTSSKPIDEVFNIISNYSNYKNFIPGCTNSEIISTDKNSQIGKLQFEILGKKYTIESRNIQDEYNLKMEQISGPFDAFNGSWNLEENSGETAIHFKADFTLPFLVNAVTPDSLIEKLSETIINSFISKLK